MPLNNFQNNLLFAIDEISDAQNGHDARETGNIYVRAMYGITADEGTKLHHATTECVWR